MLAHRGSLPLAFPFITTALAPAAAEACPQPYICDEHPAWIDLELRNAAAIPVDGALVISGKRLGGGDPLADITLEVTRDGQPIAGAFETTPHPHALIWRPAAAWQPGLYQAQGSAENPGLPDYCGDELEEFGGDFTVEPGPSGALAVPEFTATPSLAELARLDLETIACCVDAEAPALEQSYCYDAFVDFEVGACGPTQATGYFSLELIASPAATGPVAASILYTLERDDGLVETSLEPPASFSTHEAPVCITLAALDLGTGAVTVSAEQCFGQELAAELGPKDLVPDLDCPLETCAVTADGKTWDETMCTPLEPAGDTDLPTTGATEPTGEPATEPTSDTTPQSGEKGCACDQTAPSAPLLLAPLLLLARRRR